MKFSILIPDAEENFVFAVVNCISQVKEIDVYIMSNVENHLIKYSKHIKHYSYYPKNSDQTVWISKINYELEKYGINLVMPIFEEGIRTIIKHKELITLKDRLCLLPTYNNFNTALNKVLLSRHMVENKIACSPSFLFDRNATKNNEFNFPVLLKPSEGIGGGKGIFKFFNIEEIEQFLLDSNNSCDEYLIEEFFEGVDFSCNVLCKKGEILVFTIQKGILFNGVEFTSPIGVKFLFDSRLYKEVENLMKSLRWSGVANIDLRYDNIMDNFKILEINPRFWGSLDASLAAGVNFPYLYCLVSLGKEIEKHEYNFIEYLTFNALLEAIKKDYKLIFNLDFILNNTQVGFILNDPMLYLYKLYVRFKLFYMDRIKKIRFF